MSAARMVRSEANVIDRLGYKLVAVPLDLFDSDLAAVDWPEPSVACCVAKEALTFVRLRVTTNTNARGMTT